MSKKYLVWIDAYRGLLILLVILAHMNVRVHAFDGILIPAFFFISGYLLNPSYTNFPHFFKHRFRQIIVPYISFFLIAGLLTLLFYSFTGKEVSVLDSILAMLYGSFSVDMQLSKSLWFVTALFTTEIYFFFIKKYIAKRIKVMGVLLLFSALGYATTFLDFRLPWGVDIACSVVLFYGMGYFVKEYELIKYIEKQAQYIKVFFMMLLLAISYFFSMDISLYVFVLNTISHPIYTLLSGIFGVIATLYLFQMSFINRNVLLVYLGKNTFIILAFHELVMNISKKIIFSLYGHTVKEGGLVELTLYVLITLTLLVPVIEFINRVLPFILNRKQ